MKTVLQLLLPVAILGGGVAALLLVGGCGSGPAPATATVRGKVTFNGQPVAGGTVVFTPDPQRGGTGKPARAEIAPDGSFQLRVESAEQIPAGWYRVSIAPPPGSGAAGAPAFPAKLARPDLSGLEREVVPGTDHVFEFVVEGSGG